MSLYASLNSALSGLNTAQRNINVVADNVANAESEGYTRKRLQQVVDVVEGDVIGATTRDPSRIIDEFLVTEVRNQVSRAGRSDALIDYHQNIQDTLFGEPGADSRSIAANITEVTTALEEFAEAPGKAALQLQVIAAGEELADRIDAGAEAVQRLRLDADREIGQLVRDVNSELEALHEVNVNIARLGPTPDLLDRQDLILRNLSESLGIDTFRRDSGGVSAYTERGFALVEFSAYHLHYEPASNVAQNSRFGPIRIYRADDIDQSTGQPIAGARFETLVTGGIRETLTPEIDPAVDATLDPAIFTPIVSEAGSGRLQGLLEARDSVLPGLADQLAELGGGVRFEFNKRHNAGVAQPPPNQLTGTNTDLATYGAASPAAGEAFLAVVDRGDGATQASIRVDLAAAATPAALAAQIDASLGALGTAQINADGALEIALANADHGVAINEGDSAIQVVDTAGHDRTYGFSHYFGLNDFFLAEGSVENRLAVRPELRADSDLLASARLDVDDPGGGPLTLTLGGVSDNRAAQDLAAAFDSEIQTIARGALPARQSTLADYAADFVATAAVESSQAQRAADVDQELVQDVELRASSISSVSLDEELSSLLLYQQAYSVSARIVSITDQLFDELVNMTR